LPVSFSVLLIYRIVSYLLWRCRQVTRRRGVEGEKVISVHLDAVSRQRGYHSNSDADGCTVLSTSWQWLRQPRTLHLFTRCNYIR